MMLWKKSVGSKMKRTQTYRDTCMMYTKLKLKQVTNLVFYTQSTSMVIRARKLKKKEEEKGPKSVNA